MYDQWIIYLGAIFFVILGLSSIRIVHGIGLKQDLIQDIIDEKNDIENGGGGMTVLFTPNYNKRPIPIRRKGKLTY